MNRENTAPGAMVLGQQRRAPKRARRVVSAWLRPFLIVIVMMVAAGLVAMGLFPLFASAGVAVKVADSKFLSQADVPLDLPPLTQRSTIYAADGTVLATLYRDQNREVFPLSEYNDFTRHAVLAIEDHNFYQHGALDIVSILRALLANIRAHGIVQGGSTITQQLVKNTETGSAQTTQRKILEAQDAIRLERTYTKDHILGLYLNTIYMGNSVYGVGTAAQYYFNKPPNALNIAQSALLAGMIAAPERYNPTVVADQQTVKDRRNLVLANMLQYGWLTQLQYTTASSAPVRMSVKGRIANRLGPQPYWVDYVKHLFL